MTDSAFLLTTTTGRGIETGPGEPINLARDESIELVRKLDGEPLTEIEVDWVRAHVAPLMKPWGT